jgi:predicted nicotinamide N-methyase
MMLNHFFGKYFGGELTGHGAEWTAAASPTTAEGTFETAKVEGGGKRRTMMAREGGQQVKVLELGAGVGLAGLVMAKEGAMVTLTDNQPAALELIKQSAEANDINDQCEVAYFDWTDEKCYAKETVTTEGGCDEALIDWLPSGQQIGGRDLSYDYVVASDVVYEHRDQSGLIRALRKFAPPPVAGAKTIKIFMAYVHRTVKVDQFFTDVLEFFHMETLDKNELDEEFRYDKIDIFVFTPLVVAKTARPLTFEIFAEADV